MSRSWHDADLVPAGRSSRESSYDEVIQDATALLEDGHRLAMVAAHDDDSAIRVVYVFTKGPPDVRVELVVRLDSSRPRIPSLAGVSFGASRFEREMMDLFGIEPVDHPQPRRLVLHQHWPNGWYPMRHGAGQAPPMVENAGSYPFIPVVGPGIYEMPVGPVHAGLIEPGHFRFFVIGETIIRMKARLWFVHKGVERLLEGKTVAEGLEIAQRVSGDTAVGHSLSYALAVEEALGVVVAPDDQSVRGALLEMERIYNHVTDLGALCNDVAFSLANSFALSLRERLLRLNQEVTGHRLLRGGVVIGGSSVRRLWTVGEIDRIGEDVEGLVSMARSNALVLDRFMGTAVLTSEDAMAMGTVGVVARASDGWFDARVAHPFSTIPTQLQVASRPGGDVLARFDVRVEEIRNSLAMLRAWSDLESKSHGELPLVFARGDRAQQGATRSGLGICEAWRGALVHRVELDEAGLLTRVKIVDPSFLNWPALPISLADTIIPDFPLANKSFNLSYAGNDL